MKVADVEASLQHARHSQKDAETLADGLKTWFGADLQKGTGSKTDQTTVVWALQADAAPEVVSEDGTWRQKLDQVGKTGIFAAVSHLKSGDGFPFHYEVAGKRVGGGFVEVYQDDPDTFPKDGVPKGQLIEMPKWTSKVFEGVTRDWWVYIPAGLKPGQTPAVMVFQDGQWMKNYVPTTFDNLIAKGQIPPIVGIFLTPGTKPNGDSNRSFEYDTLSDQYARFLLEEILPEVEKKTPLSHDPEMRAICGMSSGGICSFTAAWEKPDQFRKVLSWIGSFTDIAHGSDFKEGGHNYPYMIRLTDKKPIRVYLQDGANDLDNLFGNWPLANQAMAKALAFKGYDYTFTLGHGNHSDRQGRAMLPEMLRWLWR